MPILLFCGQSCYLVTDFDRRGESGFQNLLLICISRYSDGHRPVAFLNSCAKWLRSLNPDRAITSLTVSDPSSSNCCAVHIFNCLIYRAVEMPKAALNRWLSLEGERPIKAAISSSLGLR